VIIRPAQGIRGRLEMPGDKSISHRAAMTAALANGSSRIKSFSTSEDCAASLRCLQQLGVSISRDRDDVLIEGVGPQGLRASGTPLDCGNSGTTMRLLAGILAGQDFTSILTGDASLRARPMQRIIEPLEMMGASILSHDGRAPLTIQGRGRLQPLEYELLLASAQVKSCILLAGLNASGRTKVIEQTPTRDHTERMLRWFGVAVEAGDARLESQSFAALTGPASFPARDVQVPGDISSAAYFVAAASLLHGSELEIANVGMNPARTSFLNFLKGSVQIDVSDEREESNEPVGTVRVKCTRDAASEGVTDSPASVRGNHIAGLIDELPLLAVVGSQLDGGLEIRDAAELRVKESDRIVTTVAGLRTMGAEVQEFDDGLRVAGPVRLHGAEIDTRGDHRIAMAFAVAGLLAEGETEIRDAECVGVSFPEFFALLESVAQR